VSPTAPPGNDTVGVVSFVASSELDVPESDDEARSGAADGADGGVVSTASDSDEEVDPAFPAASTIAAEIDHVPSARVGRSQESATPTV